jgi:tetratricopeptide (TPR) repeat protein
MERRGDLENAVAIYSDILNKEHDQQAYANLKKIYSRMEKYDDLVSLIKVYKQRFPKKMEPYLDIGEAYWKLKKESHARKEWAIAEEKFGAHVNTYKKFFYLFTNLGLSNDAQSLVDRVRVKFNDPTILSMEIANYHYSRKSYSTAVIEFLNYLSSHPVQRKMITDRILLISDDEDAHDIIVNTLNNNIKKDPKLYRPVLADYYFKTQQFDKAFTQHLTLSFSTEKNIHRWLEFANGLRIESQYEMAVSAYETILVQDNIQNSPKTVGQALLGLGKTFEDKIIPNVARGLTFVSFFDENLFFEDPFYHQQNISVQSLDTAFELYDSLLTSMPSSSFSASAYHRLGEIQFRLLNDFDGALKSYRAALKSASKSKLRKDIQLRIGEMYLSKGDLNEAQRYFLKLKKFNAEFHYRYILTQLFSGQIDTAFLFLEQAVEKTAPMSPDFNDLLELRNFISQYHQNGTDIDKHAFELFVFGEFYLRQKKLPEAAASYAFVQEHYPDASIFSNALLREALVQLKLNQIQNAEFLAEQLTKTKSAYKGWALLGEIQEIYMGNNEEALKHYFTLLEKYPDCYLAEPVRLHVRKLKDQMKS